jgi:hypothetical protein
MACAQPDTAMLATASSARSTRRAAGAAGVHQDRAQRLQADRAAELRPGQLPELERRLQAGQDQLAARPLASAAAVGSLMIRSASSRAIRPASLVGCRCAS